MLKTSMNVNRNFGKETSNSQCVNDKQALVNAFSVKLRPLFGGFSKYNVSAKLRRLLLEYEPITNVFVVLLKNKSNIRIDNQRYFVHLRIDKAFF